MIEVIRPLGYLRIKHPSSLPILINWIFPVLFSSVVTSLLLFLHPQLDIFGANGLLSRLLGFFQSLPGFYIAALAAIATFNNPDMATLMPGKPPTMKVMYQQGWEVVKLTRRRFLSSMFAYLTAISLLGTFAMLIGLSAAPAIRDTLNCSTASVIKWVGAWCYLFVCAQLLFVTFWGLFYLGERLHTPDK